MVDMRYAPLGWSGIQVSKVCLGGMSFGEASPDFHQWTIDRDATERVIGHAIDSGVNFIDTANCYAFGTSETYIGRALKRLGISRDRVVLASKVYFNEGHLSQEAINHEIDGTLKRLGTDYLDLYIIHRFDYGTPIEETMEALDALVKAGKVRALGASEMYLHAGYGGGEWLDEVHQHAVPLQSALPRGRTRDDSGLPPVRRSPDPILPHGLRPLDKTEMEFGFQKKHHGQYDAQQI